MAGHIISQALEALRVSGSGSTGCAASVSDRAFGDPSGVSSERPAKSSSSSTPAKSSLQRPQEMQLLVLQVSIPNLLKEHVVEALDDAEALLRVLKRFKKILCHRPSPACLLGDCTCPRLHKALNGDLLLPGCAVDLP